MNASQEAARERGVRRFDRAVDITSLVLISLAAVLSAVCGYQSARWSGLQSRLYNLASANRVQAAEAGTRSIALTAIDVATFLQYVDAVASGDTRKQAFLRQRFRPQMRTAFEAWLRTKPLTNKAAPSSPFKMPSYERDSEKQEKRYDALATANFDGALTANNHADNFLLLTIVFAGVSFLAGISTKMTYPRHLIVVAVGCIGLVYGLIRLVELPFR